VLLTALGLSACSLKCDEPRSSNFAFDFKLRRCTTEVAARLAEVTAVAARVYALWTWEERTGVSVENRQRAASLRDGIAKLGPVFVKMAQTLSTR
jgi:predicted unusual protein kinase regulating ubiquinone biosynthesis (AarF/ABC1/UbiB family)